MICLAAICRWKWLLAVMAAGLLLAIPTVRAADSQLPAETASGKLGSQPPPKFDSDVLELFATDARTKIGPGQPGGTAPKA
ncbi:MAG TPA: hypothetical protein VMF30_05880, partial [Pirellulales bacterium]|nr:hypothetical protein [Pirellulales bacterium]